MFHIRARTATGYSSYSSKFEFTTGNDGTSTSAPSRFLLWKVSEKCLSHIRLRSRACFLSRPQILRTRLIRARCWWLLRPQSAASPYSSSSHCSCSSRAGTGTEAPSGHHSLLFMSVCLCVCLITFTGSHSAPNRVTEPCGASFLTGYSLTLPNYAECAQTGPSVLSDLAQFCKSDTHVARKLCRSHAVSSHAYVCVCVSETQPRRPHILT